MDINNFIVANNNKSIELISYIVNLNKDVLNMKNVCKQLEIWKNNGIELSVGIKSINEQINKITNKMKTLLEQMKNNIIELKKVDDKINNPNKIDIQIENFTLTDDFLSDWEKIFDIYHNLYNNLSDDVSILNNAIKDIQQYNQLGIKLGSAISTIQEQVNSINTSAKNSSEELENIILSIKEESMKIEIDSFIEKKIDTDVNNQINSHQTDLSVKSFYKEEYSGFKKSVVFDHSIIKNNESKFELFVSAKSYTLNYLGALGLIGGGVAGNRMYIGWEGSGKIMIGLGNILIKTLNKYNDYINQKIDIRYIQYGNKTGRFVINGNQEDLIDIPNYIYTSTNTFYYNGHYDNHGSHYGTTYSYFLFG